MNVRLQQIHRDMKTRCYNTKSKQYKWYGAKGITVCAEWLDTSQTLPTGRGRPCSKGFIAFREWAINNGYADNLTLDRIDNDKGYSPDNCRWATMKEQANNRSSNCHHITYKGQTKNLLEWSKELNIPYASLWVKMNRNGWSLESVLSVL